MSGTLQASVVKDEASATNNLTLNTSGGVTVGQNLTVTGTSAFTGSLGNVTTGTISSGNITSSGTVADATGTLRPLVSGTAQASTSGTSITFSSIPSWAKRITVMFNGVSLSGTANYLVQIGSGSVVTTGYVSVGTATGTTSGSQNTTSGFMIYASNAALVFNGTMTLCLMSGNTWVESHVVSTAAGVVSTYYGGGVSPALSGALDRVVITTTNGTDTFDAGSINILYE